MVENIEIFGRKKNVPLICDGRDVADLDELNVLPVFDDRPDADVAVDEKFMLKLSDLKN